MRRREGERSGRSGCSAPSSRARRCGGCSWRWATPASPGSSAPRPQCVVGRRCFFPPLPAGHGGAAAAAA
eukprot:7232780-Pyramimonas_sp.AAC.1